MHAAAGGEHPFGREARSASTGRQAAATTSVVEGDDEGRDDDDVRLSVVVSTRPRQGSQLRSGAWSLRRVSITAFPKPIGRVGLQVERPQAW